MVYIDNEFKCHVNNPQGIFREAKTGFFDGKCATFVAGYLFVPFGERLVSSDGLVFFGEMVAPWKPYNELIAAQAQYELDMAEAAAAYQEGVNSAYDQ